MHFNLGLFYGLYTYAMVNIVVNNIIYYDSVAVTVQKSDARCTHFHADDVIILCDNIMREIVIARQLKLCYHNIHTIIHAYYM